MAIVVVIVIAVTVAETETVARAVSLRPQRPSPMVLQRRLLLAICPVLFALAVL